VSCQPCHKVIGTFGWWGICWGTRAVSTAEQNPDLQVDELTAAGCWRVWNDLASGALDRRPQLDAVLEQLRPGDTLVVWRLDRLGRSLRHLIEVLTGLDECGVGFRSLRESIDTTTAGGRLVFHLFGTLAQFEREIIRDRTVAGLTAARARGQVGGRPSKLTAEQVRQARGMYDARELTVEQIGAVLGVSRTSIYRALSKDTTPSRCRGRLSAGDSWAGGSGAWHAAVAGCGCGRGHQPSASSLGGGVRIEGFVGDRRRGRVGAEGISPGARAADCRCSGGLPGPSSCCPAAAALVRGGRRRRGRQRRGRA
jgi:DNA invertase Pin-like site-specific DNA recombinase